jgi:putative transposase
MRGPKPPTIELTEGERCELAALVRRRTTPQQVALRARLVLAAAAGLNNAQVARQEGGTWRRPATGVRAGSACSRWRWPTCAWRSGWPTPPRSGTPARITAEQVCQIVALACDAPTTSGRPSSQWTGREVADEIVARDIVPALSPRHAGRLLKRGRSSRTASAPG